MIMITKKKSVVNPRKYIQVKFFLNSSCVFLKNEIEKYPSVEKAINTDIKVDTVVKRLKYPYSAGGIKLANMTRRRNDIPFPKKE